MFLNGRISTFEKKFPKRIHCIQYDMTIIFHFNEINKRQPAAVRQTQHE